MLLSREGILYRLFPHPVSTSFAESVFNMFKNEFDTTASLGAIDDI